MAIDSAAKAVGGTALKPLQREAFVVVRPGKVDYLFLTAHYDVLSGDTPSLFKRARRESKILSAR